MQESNSQAMTALENELLVMAKLANSKINAADIVEVLARVCGRIGAKCAPDVENVLEVICHGAAEGYEQEKEGTA